MDVIKYPLIKIVNAMRKILDLRNITIENNIDSINNRFKLVSINSFNKTPKMNDTLNKMIGLFIKTPTIIF